MFSLISGEIVATPILYQWSEFVWINTSYTPLDDDENMERGFHIVNFIIVCGHFCPAVISQTENKCCWIIFQASDTF